MSRHEHPPPHGWLRRYRPAWWFLAGVVGAPGIAGAWLEIGAGSALFLLAGLTVLATLGVWQVGPQHGEGRPGGSTVVVGAACALGFVALVGLGYELGAAGLACGILVATAGWPLRPRRTTARPEPPAAAPQPPPGPPIETVAVAPFPESSAVRRLSTPELCWTWRASYVCLRRYPWPSYLECLADVRRECLDELERRDPVAFGRWFATARAASDPARYFCARSKQ